MELDGKMINSHGHDVAREGVQVPLSYGGWMGYGGRRQVRKDGHPECRWALRPGGNSELTSGDQQGNRKAAEHSFLDPSAGVLPECDGESCFFLHRRCWQLGRQAGQQLILMPAYGVQHSIYARIYALSYASI